MNIEFGNRFAGQRVAAAIGTACAAILVLGTDIARSEIHLGKFVTGQGLGVRKSTDAKFMTDNLSHNIVWENNNRRIVLDGVNLFLNSAPQQRRGIWYIADQDAWVVAALLRPAPYLAGHGYSTVVLDPGHGGEFGGAAGPNGCMEKGLTLDVARRVREKLRETGLLVFLTRDRDKALARDRNLDLLERCRRAAYVNADLLVSIHFNSSGDRSATGLETYVAPATGYPATAQLELQRQRTVSRSTTNRFDAASTILAQYLQKGILHFADGEDRGVKRAHFMVLQCAPCPAALVECGFLSNRREGDRIMSETYRDSIAEGIAAGIRTYVSHAREGRLGKLPGPKPAGPAVPTAKR